MTDTPKPDSALARSDAIFRARGIPIIENKSKEISITFVGPLGAAALLGLAPVEPGEELPDR